MKTSSRLLYILIVCGCLSTIGCSTSRKLARSGTEQDATAPVSGLYGNAKHSNRLAANERSSAQQRATSENEDSESGASISESVPLTPEDREAESVILVHGMTSDAGELPTDTSAAKSLDINASGTGVPLTLSDLQQIALQNNPTLPLASREIEKERGHWLQNGLYPNPTVGYVNSSTTTNGQSQQNGILVQQTFITAGKLEKARATEAWGIQETLSEAEAQQIRVLNDVRLRYYDVLAAVERLKVTKEIAELAQSAVEITNKRFTLKEVSKTDILQAEVQWQKIQLASRNAQHEYDAAWRKLAVIIGCPDMTPTTLAESSEDLPEFNLETETQRLMSASPQLKAAQADIGIARGNWASADAARIPDITVQFVSQYDSIGNYGTFNSLVALPVPIFDRNQGGRYTASQEYCRTQIEYERVQLVLRDQLVTAHGRYLVTKEEAERTKQQILPQIKENLDLTIEAYRRGESSYLSVVSAQELLFETNQTYLNSLTEARRLAVEIEGLQLTGGLNPSTIGTAIQETGAADRLRALSTQQKQESARLSNFAPATMK